MTFITDLSKEDLQGKRVLVRASYDLPLDEQGAITDERRVIDSLPTIQFLLEQEAKIILFAHSGRPKGKVDPLRSMKVVGECLSKHLNTNVKTLKDCVGNEVEQAITKMQNKEIILLENVRFHKEEKSKDENERTEFGKQMAAFADIYIQDAYANAHHDQASMTAVPKFIPCYIGIALKKELDALQPLENPEQPYVAIIGGAKAEKVNVVKNLLKKVDKIIIGGILANTFLKASGVDIGNSKYDEETLPLIKDLPKEKIIIPIDVVAAESFDKDAKTVIVDTNNVPPTNLIIDIGPKTIQLYAETLKKAKTVVWCGPIGVNEWDSGIQGTKQIAETLAQIKETTYVLIGGGDSGAAIEKLNLEEKMGHVSTGGGATLTWLSGKGLVAVDILNK